MIPRPCSYRPVSSLDAQGRNPGDHGQDSDPHGCIESTNSSYSRKRDRKRLIRRRGEPWP
jgi:hypothetical protein